MSPTISSSSPHGEADAPAVTPGVAHIGCSGWHYKSWRGVVYPAEMPTAEWLRAYTRRFTTVELNNSFYRLPSEETFAAWREQVPARFVFAVKASRFLTHIKRLREPEEPIDRLLSHAKGLGRTLGPVLYQIPPRWFPDPERLETFLAALPEISPVSSQRLRHVLEVRDPRGYEAWVIELLRRYNVALCVHDMHGSESPLIAVGPILYVRFHGYGTKYGGSYPDHVLDEWAEWIRRVLAAGRDAFVYFNNDINAYAVYDAERLRQRVLGAAAPGGPMPRPDPQHHEPAYGAYPVARTRRRATTPTRRTISTRKGGSE